jgi:hypothetical protein
LETGIDRLGELVCHYLALNTKMLIVSSLF